MLHVQKGKYKNIIICFLLLLITAIGLFAGNEAIYAEEKQTVKVAFFPMDGYHIVESDGSYSGMDVKYLEALQEYTDWQIEYVECDSWADALDKLSNQEVDLVGSAQYTEERAQIYEYANLSSGHTIGAIATTQDSSIAYEDFVAMENITYGMVKGYVRETEFLEYLAENGIEEPKVLEYENTEQLHKALENGEIDAFVHTFTEIREGQRLIGRFAPMPFYYITYKGNDELLQQLNHALNDLKISKPELEAELMNEFYYSRLDVNTLLTTDEKEYIAGKKRIIVGYLAEFYPFSYEENGEFKGLARNMLEECLGETGLQFVYMKVDNQTVAKEALKNGQIDILAYYTDDREHLSANGLTNVNDYAEIPLAIVTKKGKELDDIKSISTVLALSDEVGIVLSTDTITLQIGETQQNCMNALVESMTDGVLCSAYLAEHLLRTEIRYSDLQIESVLQREYPVTMLVRDSDIELAGIMNKTLTVIDVKVINEYLLQENIYPLITIEEFFKNNSLTIIMILIALLIIIIYVAWHMIRDSKKIQDLMYKDIKMNIWNLNYLMMIGDNRLATEKKHKYAICYLNLAYFRQYNIIYGWNAAEKLLETVADILTDFVDKKEEICARNQDDHFVLFLEVTEESEFMDRLYVLKKKLEKQILKDTDNHIPVQMGIYSIPQDGSVDIHLAVSYANQAADFLAFEKSGDIKVYDEELEQSIKERHAREKLLESVDINKDFTVFYQPKVDIRTNKIVGAEALVRFMNPTANGTICAPGFFIPYFEQNGRITEVDMFVYESTCKMLRRRMDKGLSVVPVSCNFSRVHFIKPGFPEQFEAVLEKYNISKALIEVEITETLVIEELQHHMIKQTIDVLREKGIRLSIDDFGAGYSSLGVFEQIPASVVKLDRSFLLNQVDRERQVKIMRGIVKLSDELGAEVVCEGVETEKDIELMHEVGAHVAQGYYFSKPISEEEFDSKLNLNV